MNFFFAQLFRFAGDPLDEGVFVEHPGVEAAGLFYDVPAGVEDDGADGDFLAGFGFKNLGEAAGAGGGLDERVAVGLAAVDENFAAVVGDGVLLLVGLADRFGFDEKHAAGADDDVVEIVVTFAEVVKDLVVERPQDAVEQLPDGALAEHALA